MFFKEFFLDWIDTKYLNLHIYNDEKKEIFYIEYSNNFSIFKDLVYFNYRVYLDKNWNILDKDELII